MEYKWRILLGWTCVVIAFLFVITPYIGWHFNPEMTYMEMTITYAWNWVGAMVFSAIAIYLHNDFS